MGVLIYKAVIGTVTMTIKAFMIHIFFIGQVVVTVAENAVDCQHSEPCCDIFSGIYQLKPSMESIKL
jgi:hypothetical protein